MTEYIYMSENNWLLLGIVVAICIALIIAFGKDDD